MADEAASTTSSDVPNRKRRTGAAKFRNPASGKAKVKGQQQSLIRVKRCKDCNSQFLLGEEPGSAYYKPCRCGRSDIERKARQEIGQRKWIPLNLDQIETPDAAEVIQVENAVQTRNRFERFVAYTNLGSAWHDLNESFYSFREQKTEVLKHKLGKVQRQLLSPEAISFQAPNQPRRYRKSRSITNWFQRFRSELSFRRTRALIWPKTKLASAQPRVPEMSDTGRLVTSSSRSNLTLEYENPTFEKDLDTEEDAILKWKEEQHDDDSRKSFSTSGNQSILQNNFTIGSTTSLIVAMLSNASFAFFVLWFLLYCSTLHVILPEMKYLHKYVTLCSLVLLTSINIFRFYICRNATTNENSYLFTGTKTMTVLVIGALTSLLVTDAYAAPPRCFHIIISSIQMTLLIAEFVAVVCHHRFLRAFVRSRTDSTLPALETIRFQPKQKEKRQ